MLETLMGTERRLRAGELGALAQLIRDLGLDSFQGDAILSGSDPIIQSPHYLGEASATAQLAIGVAVAVLLAHRGKPQTDVRTDVISALHYLHPTHFVTQQGRVINVGAENVAVNDTFLCKDGRYLMLEAGPPYAKLLKGYSRFFDCGDDKAMYAREVAKWDSAALEDALSAAGLPACRAFTREEWLDHPQGRVLGRTPVIEIEKIADGPPTLSSPAAQAPLERIRVLDFSHVLAGPRSARTLAEHGADVLHISSPSYPDTFAQHLGVDVGKRCAYLDLRDEADNMKMHELARSADVFVNTYRRSVVERFGLLPEQLAASSEKGIVCMTANAYGHEGPWKERPGFDQNGQVASGFAMAEGEGGKPRFSPVFYLADLITGYLAAAGMMAALLRRSSEGGSYHVKVSLTRSAMWVQEFGLLDLSRQAELPRTDSYEVRRASIDSPYGEVSFLAPALHFSAYQQPDSSLLMPYGAVSPAWLSDG